MNSTEIKDPTSVDAIASLDLSMFDHADMVNITLQRSRVLYDIPRAGKIIRNWVGGNSAPIDQAVSDIGADIVRRALAIVLQEYSILEQHLKAFEPRRIADIGCGYGFIDLFIWRNLGTELILLDIEESENRNFGYKPDGAGYSNLETARRFLTANGVPESAITTINPKKQDLMATGPIDVAISLLSCGFHYPLSTYSSYFDQQLKPGGGVIVDIMEKNFADQQEAVAAIGRVTGQYFHVKGTNRTIITKAG